jgi:hypothetical protein
LLLRVRSRLGARASWRERERRRSAFLVWALHWRIQRRLGALTVERRTFRASVRPRH